MMQVLGKKYANITRDVVELFKSLCVECLKKRKRGAVKGVVVKPILTKDYGSRGQVDLVDMQSMPDGNFKWIMVYQDHFTKFCVLRPLCLYIYMWRFRVPVPCSIGRAPVVSVGTCLLL